MAQDYMQEYRDAERELDRIVSGLSRSGREAWATLNAWHEGFDGETPSALDYLQTRLRTRTLFSEAEAARAEMNRWR